MSASACVWMNFEVAGGRTEVARRVRIDHLETTMFRSLKTSRSKRQCVQLLCILAGWPVLSFSLSCFITPSAHAAAGQEQAALQSESTGADARHGPPTPRGYRIINVVNGKNVRATNFNARD